MDDLSLDDEHRRRNARRMAGLEEKENQRRQQDMLAGYDSASFIGGLGGLGLGFGQIPSSDVDNSMPVFRTLRDAAEKTITRRTFKFHPAHERWLVYYDNTYRTPGKDIKKDMIHELTIPQHNMIKTVSADWAHIAKPGREVDREIVLELARVLFGDRMNIEFSPSTPVFNKHSYERLIDRQKMEAFQRELVWEELTAALQEELIPAEYHLFFDGLSDPLQAPIAERKQMRAHRMAFATLDFIQRAVGPAELEPYKNTLLFVRLVGGFFFENPQKLIIYDYPKAVHSSKEFGNKEVLHNPKGAAIAYGDGSGVYAIEGFEFTQRVIERTDSITITEIEAENNMERRRILTDQMGIGRYLHETKAHVIDMDMVRVMTVGDDDRAMPRALIQATDGRRFLCGTDGSTKRVYYMPVPRDATTCRMAHEAIAGPVGIRSVRLDTEESRRRGWAPSLALGLDEKDCIAQS